jgi:hypothetical protein
MKRKAPDAACQPIPLPLLARSQIDLVEIAGDVRKISTAPYRNRSRSPDDFDFMLIL